MKSAVFIIVTFILILTLNNVNAGQLSQFESELNNPKAVRNVDREDYRLKNLQSGGYLSKKIESKRNSVPEGAEKIKLLLREINFNKSLIFSEKKLNEISYPYIGKEISIADLFKLVDKINVRYREKGYITTQAILPAQDIDHGIVRVQLIEGTVGKVSVENNRQVRSGFIVDRTGIRSGTIPTIHEIERRIATSNWYRNYRVTTSLKPGELPVTTDLILDVNEQYKPFSVAVNLDNYGSVQSGKYSAGLTGSFYSLLGFDEIINIGYSTSAAQVGNFFKNSDINSYFVDITTPLPVGNGTVRLMYSHSNSKVIQGQFSRLGINGKGDSITATVYQPFYTNSAIDLSFLFGGQWSKSRNMVGIVTTDSSALRAFAGIRARANIFETKSYLESELRAYYTHSVIRGLSGSQKRNFGRLTGSLTAYQVLPYGFSLEVTGTGQIAFDKRLPSADQWNLGGVGSLPAYETSAINGDTGFQLSTSLRFEPEFVNGALSDLTTQDVRLGVRAFADIGAAYDDVRTEIRKMYFGDFGIGADLNIENRLSANLTVAWPVKAPRGTNLNIKNPKILFKTSLKY